MKTHVRTACYYQWAMRLQGIAQDMLEGDPRSGITGRSETAVSLLARVREMHRDNPDCWATNGRCGKCPSLSCPAAGPEGGPELHGDSDEIRNGSDHARPFDRMTH